MSDSHSSVADQNTSAMAQQHLEAAVDWFVLLRDGAVDEKTLQDWRRWLQQSTAHRSAWDFVSARGKCFACLQSGSESRAAASVLQERQHQRLSRRKVLALITGFAGSSLLSWAAYKHPSLNGAVTAWRADEHTAIGEIRELALVSGFRAWLNTASMINTNLDDGFYNIELLQGEMFIATDANHRQPLQVYTQHGYVRPLGTQFDVRKQPQSTLVAVYQGAVEIQTALTAKRKIIQAGEQLTFTDTEVGPVGEADQARKAWTKGVLLAQDITLKQLITELARYQRGYLTVDPEVAGLRVLGGYPLNDPARALEMLSVILPINIHRPLPWWTTIKPAD